MIKIALIVFRECLEISLLLSLILASTKELMKSRFYISLGAILGVFFSTILAILISNIHKILSFIQNDIFEAMVMLTTSTLIIWTIVWLQGHHIWIKNKVSQLSDQIHSSNKIRLHYWTLTFIVTTTILREGTEIVLLVYGVSSSPSMHNITMIKKILAFFAGSASGFFIGAIIYYGLVKISIKNIFKISSFLLILVSASFASEAASKLTSSGTINILNEELWNSSWLISNSSILGKIFSLLTGYDPTPNALQLIFYLSNLILSFILLNVRKFTFLKKINKNVKVN
ncbi:MAG: FTR1 family protein [Rickettsia sp.]|nr:FTR1 family protein [Rickettsia sp.]